MSGVERLRIGLADDNVTFCRILQDFFNSMSEMKVAGVAHDGPTALELVRNADLDALLLDIILPKLDGFAVLEKTRDLPKKPRIIVFSAFCNEEMTKRAIALGADYFIVKPFALEVLAQRIKEICGRGEEKPPGYIRDEVELEKQVSGILQRLKIPAHYKGYAYLRAAILLCIKDPALINEATRKLYPKIAKEFNSTRQRVERAMRFAIETAWSRAKVEDLHDLMGYTVDERKGKPTNICFIAQIADKIQLERKMNLKHR